MRITRYNDRDVLKLSQEAFVKKVLSSFKMDESKPVSTPLASHFKLSNKQSPSTEQERAYMVKVSYAYAIRSLMYAIVYKKPDILYAVEVGFVDADMAGDIDSRKSTSGYVYKLGGTTVSWMSKLQKIVTLFTSKAEYIAMTEASKEMIWLQSFVKELDHKHVLKNGILALEKIQDSQNSADILIKTVTIEKLKLCATSKFSSSYNTLPYQLKSCIAHLSLFLENTRIDVEHLYLLWMAEGTISRDSEINTNMMGVAERYFSELVQRNVVQVREEEAPNWRKYSSFCVHNTIHQLCFSKGKEHFFEFLDLSCETRSTSNSSSSCSSSNPTRRLALYLRNQDTGYAAVPFTNEISKHLRCLLLVNRDDLQIKLEWPRGLPDLAKFRILRVLNFERFEFQGRKLLRGISKLFRLRYLSFKGCILEELPSSIGNLSLLWFLDLRVSSKMKIPNVLYKMEELKNLYLPLLFQTSTNDKLCLGKLKKLEVLENFNTGVCNVADLLEMKNLRNLSVTVEGNLEDLELVVQRMNASRHVLPWRGRLLYPLVMVNKFDCYTEERHLVFKKLLDSQFLRTLHMDGHLGYIPSNSKINSGLTEIVLKGSQLKEDPMTTLSEFPELQVLVLQDNAFVGKEMNCSASGFQELKRLEFSNLCFLETWEVEGESMPKLSTLTVKNCRKLQMLPNGLRLRVSSVTFENDN
ncbi:Disease resistance protein (CC-NBS-LRR class) family [Abeliophyllum distichum]|uniref:Disease resistance protein (CC-NBS-LRR class) family n=1 Tax=Abeliophyllum distichum TaxID=126358 RepID=A0ABD1Q1Y5_9LAMI